MGGSKNEAIPSALSQRQQNQRQLQPMGCLELEHSKKVHHRHAQLSEQLVKSGKLVHTLYLTMDVEKK